MEHDVLQELAKGDLSPRELLRALNEKELSGEPLHVKIAVRLRCECLFASKTSAANLWDDLSDLQASGQIAKAEDAYTITEGGKQRIRDFQRQITEQYNWRSV